MQDDLDTIQTLLHEVRDQAVSAIPVWYGPLRRLVDDTLPKPPGVLTLLPLIGAKSSGGRLLDTIPLLTLWTLLVLAVRLLDDAADQDGSGLYTKIGVPRTNNFGAALLIAAEEVIAKSTMSSRHKDLILTGYRHLLLRLSNGQERTLTSEHQSIDTYMKLIGDKTCHMTSFALVAGAQLGSPSSSELEAAELCGYHLGYVLRLVDDIEGVWFPAAGESVAKKLTYPVLVAAHLDPGNAEALFRLASQDPPDLHQIRVVLDSLGVRGLVLRTIMQHRRRAEAALSLAPADCQALLSAWLGWALKDINAMHY